MIMITSTSPKGYHEIVAKALERLEKHRVRGLALVALTEKGNLTCYWNMNTSDKAQAEHEIRLDVFDSFLESNKGRYCLDDQPEQPQ